ncbi:unnamed protein product [Prorocentrum cordatum]|uniref:Uncharacterized protein n=1 Tax=Prorocentrum cordatum TaxID=2364126 RepID=A0ABN9UIA4_9DINO|nr:unnamed protein product [Polarella glacialis]
MPTVLPAGGPRFSSGASELFVREAQWLEACLSLRLHRGARASVRSLGMFPGGLPETWRANRAHVPLCERQSGAKLVSLHTSPFVHHEESLALRARAAKRKATPC